MEELGECVPTSRAPGQRGGRRASGARRDTTDGSTHTHVPRPCQCDMAGWSGGGADGAHAPNCCGLFTETARGVNPTTTTNGRDSGISRVGIHDSRLCVFHTYCRARTLLAPEADYSWNGGVPPRRTTQHMHHTYKYCYSSFSPSAHERSRRDRVEIHSSACVVQMSS